MNTKKAKRTTIPKEFRSLEEAGAFWDTHSAAEYGDQMEDVEMQVDIQKRRFVVLLDDAVYRVAREQAKAKRISPDELVNQLLKRDFAKR